MLVIALMTGTMAVAGPTLPPRGITALGLKRDKLDVLTCQDRPGCNSDPQARYRMAVADNPEITSKDRAFAADGTRCHLMGPTVCASSTYPVLRSGEDPLTTIASNFPQ